MKSFREHLTEIAKIGLIDTRTQIGSTVSNKGRDELHKTMPIRKLSTWEDADKTQRGTASKDSETNVRKMMQHIRNGGKVPPVVVRQLPKPTKSGQTHQVIDGHHRLEAHRRLGLGSIKVRVARPANITKNIDNGKIYKQSA